MRSWSWVTSKRIWTLMFWDGRTCENSDHYRCYNMIFFSYWMITKYTVTDLWKWSYSRKSIWPREIFFWSSRVNIVIQIKKLYLTSIDMSISPGMPSHLLAKFWTSDFRLSVKTKKLIFLFGPRKVWDRMADFIAISTSINLLLFPHEARAMFIASFSELS